MQFHGAIHQFPKEIRLLILAFLTTLSIGFYSGLTFVKDTTNANPKGIEQRYLGNEEDEEATKMMFKKSSGEIKTMVHNHILSLSVIFLLLSLILSTTSISKKLKLFLMIEPFLSIILTFGGIYVMWLGVTWMKYVIIVSGFFMAAVYTISVIVIVRETLVRKTTS